MLILYEWLNLLSINKWNIPSNAIQDVYIYIYIHMCGKVEPSIVWDLKLYSMRYYFRVVLISPDLGMIMGNFMGIEWNMLWFGFAENRGQLQSIASVEEED